MGTPYQERWHILSGLIGIGCAVFLVSSLMAFFLRRGYPRWGISQMVEVPTLPTRKAALPRPIIPLEVCRPVRCGHEAIPYNQVVSRLLNPPNCSGCVWHFHCAVDWAFYHTWRPALEFRLQHLHFAAHKQDHDFGYIALVR